MTLTFVPNVLDGQKRGHSHVALTISRHGFKELTADDITIEDLLSGLPTAEVVEEYPDYFKGAVILTLQRDGVGRPIHLLWGVPAGRSTPAVLVTAYRPDQARWEDDWKTRRRT